MDYTRYFQAWDPYKQRSAKKNITQRHPLTRAESSMSSASDLLNSHGGKGEGFFYDPSEILLFDLFVPRCKTLSESADGSRLSASWRGQALLGKPFARRRLSGSFWHDRQRVLGSSGVEAAGKEKDQPAFLKMNRKTNFHEIWKGAIVDDRFVCVFELIFFFFFSFFSNSKKKGDGECSCLVSWSATRRHREDFERAGRKDSCSKGGFGWFHRVAQVVVSAAAQGALEGSLVFC